MTRRVRENMLIRTLRPRPSTRWPSDINGMSKPHQVDILPFNEAPAVSSAGKFEFEICEFLEDRDAHDELFLFLLFDSLKRMRGSRDHLLRPSSFGETIKGKRPPPWLRSCHFYTKRRRRLLLELNGRQTSSAASAATQ